MAVERRKTDTSKKDANNFFWHTKKWEILKARHSEERNPNARARVAASRHEARPRKGSGGNIAEGAVK